MKLNNQPYRTVALLLLVLLAAACTGEDDFATLPDEGTTSAAPLTITVTDGAYAPAPEPDGGNTPDTRAVERGYGTEFTKGDRIGLYVVEKKDASDQYSTRTFLQQNLCLTHDGTDWTLPAGTELTYQPPEGGEILYFAYYPYQGGMTDKVDIYARNESDIPTTEARWFFKPLINGWSPADDQSTYEAYTANDLMVARGEVAKRTDGTADFALSFTMEHQMALAVIRVPTTVYTYDETIDGASKSKSYRLYSGVTIPGWLANDNTYRYLANPLNSRFKISGSYYNASLKKRDFKGNTSPNESGKYFLYTVDKGEETETRRALQEGDFYMRDGGVIPKENINGNMPADVQKDCLGVVFWVGENKKNHWTQTGEEKRGDRLLMRDHPGCVHGMVVALRDATARNKWAEGPGASEHLYDWAKAFDGFNSEEQADWLAIKDSYVLTYGYCSSHLMKLYRTHHPGATFPAYNTISEYAARHPVPGSSSGWFLPAQGELVMMCYGILTDYSQSRPTTQRDLLNDLFTKAGGDVLQGTYWSTYNFEQTAWYLNFDNQTNFGYDDKSTPNKVRAVLAF